MVGALSIVLVLLSIVAPGAMIAPTRADADPCALPSGMGLHAYTLDPDARYSRFSSGTPDAFQSEIQSTCQHVRKQVALIRTQLPPKACEGYVDPSDQLGYWDTRRCLSTAAVQNFRRDVHFLLAASDPNPGQPPRVYHSYQPEETTRLLTILDTRCGANRNTSLAERAACWEREGHAVMDRAKAAADEAYAAKGDFCHAISSLPAEEKSLLSLMTTHPGVDTKCASTPPDLNRCSQLSAAQIACARPALLALGEDHREYIASHQTSPKPHYLTDRLAAIAAQAAKVSVLSRICAAGMKLEALTGNAQTVPPLTDEVTLKKCRIEDIRELQNMKPADWASWLTQDDLKLKKEPNRFDKPLPPRPQLPPDFCANCSADSPDRKPSTGAEPQIHRLMPLIQAGLSADEKDAGPATAPSEPKKENSKKAPPRARVSAPSGESLAIGVQSPPALPQDLALLKQMGFKLPEKGQESASPVAAAILENPGPAKTRDVRSLAQEANTRLSDFSADGNTPAWKSSSFWVESETEKKISSKDPVTSAQLAGWNQAVAEAVHKAGQELAQQPKDASYEQKVKTVMKSLHADYLKFYRADRSGVVDYFSGGYGNLTAQSKFMTMALADLGLMAAGPGKRRDTQRVLLRDSLEGGTLQKQIVVFDPRTREVWDPLSHQRTHGSPLPLYEPEILFHAYLETEKQRSGVAPAVTESQLRAPGTEPLATPSPVPVASPDPQTEHHRPATPEELEAARRAMVAINWDPGPSQTKSMNDAIATAEKKLSKEFVAKTLKQLPKNKKGFDLFAAIKALGKLPKGVSLSKALSILIDHPEIVQYADRIPEISQATIDSIDTTQMGELELPSDLSAAVDQASKSGGGSGGSGFDPFKAIGSWLGGSNPSSSSGPMEDPLHPGNPLDLFDPNLGGKRADIQKDEILKVVDLYGWVRKYSETESKDGKTTRRVVTSFADPAHRDAYAAMKTQAERERFLGALGTRDVREKMSKVPIAEMTAAFEDPRILARINQLPETYPLDDARIRLDRLKDYSSRDYNKLVSELRADPRLTRLRTQAREFQSRVAAMKGSEWEAWVKLLAGTPASKELDLDQAQRSMRWIREAQTRLSQLDDYLNGFGKREYPISLQSKVRALALADPSARWISQRTGQTPIDAIEGQVIVDEIKARLARNARSAVRGRAGTPNGKAQKTIPADPMDGMPEIFGVPAWEGNRVPPKPAESVRQIAPRAGVTALQGQAGQTHQEGRPPRDKQEGVEAQKGAVTPGGPSTVGPHDWPVSLIAGLLFNDMSLFDPATAQWLIAHGTPALMDQFPGSVNVAKHVFARVGAAMDDRRQAPSADAGVEGLWRKRTSVDLAMLQLTALHPEVAYIEGPKDARFTDFHASYNDPKSQKSPSAWMATKRKAIIQSLTQLALQDPQFKPQAADDETLVLAYFKRKLAEHLKAPTDQTRRMFWDMKKDAP